MAGRIRSIKPEILEDEKTAALSHLAWRLFVSLWLIADDYGNLRGDPVYVLGQTLWATAETRETVAGALGELAAVGLIVRYTVRGQSYCHIAGWAKHQKVTHAGKPRMPGPDEADAELHRAVETIVRSSGNPPETLTPDLRPPTSDLRSPTEDPSPARAIPPDPVPVAPAPMVAPADADREARRVVQLELRAELERERREVAAELGVVDHGLLAQDPGERELAMHLVAAGPSGLAAARSQALHAIAMAGLEARADPRKFRWLTGAIFGERNFRRLVATTAAEAKRAPTPAKGEMPAPARPRRKPAEQPLQISTLTPEERIAAAAEERARLATLLSDGARAPPRSASEATDERQQPEPTRKAT